MGVADWLVAGRRSAAFSIYDERNRLDRTTALRLWTEGGAWFSTEAGKKGRFVAGQLADVAVLSADYFQVPDEAIRNITSVLTVVGGRIVHGAGSFGSLAPPLPPASPDWSPVRAYGGYAASTSGVAANAVAASAPKRIVHACIDQMAGGHGLWGTDGCSCFAF